MAKINYRQMPAPRELSQQIPALRAKARMQKPQGGGNFWCKSLGVVGGGGEVMDGIDTCIIRTLNGPKNLLKLANVQNIGLILLGTEVHGTKKFVQTRECSNYWVTCIMKI